MLRYATILIALITCSLGVFSANAEIEDFTCDDPWYLGMNVGYFLGNDSYVTSITAGEQGFSSSMTFDYGLSGSVEVGKSLYDGKINIGAMLIYSNVTNESSNNAVFIGANIFGALLTFEYVFLYEEDWNIYLGAGLGAAYGMVSGGFLSMIPGTDSERWFFSDFYNINDALLIYNVRFGIYLTANMPLSLRIGYQFFGTTTSQSSVSGKTHIATYYNNSPIYGNATHYEIIENVPIDISDIQFKYHVLEIGVKFLFDT